MKLYKTGSIAFVLLGILHTIAHFMGNLHPSNETLTVLNQMKALNIQLFGTHNLLQFHNGFSIMMGVLLSVFGIQNLIIAKSVTRTYHLSSIIISVILLLLSIVYFHLLAIAFLFFSVVCYVWAYKQQYRKYNQ